MSRNRILSARAAVKDEDNDPMSRTHSPTPSSPLAEPLSPAASSSAHKSKGKIKLKTKKPYDRPSPSSTSSKPRKPRAVRHQTSLAQQTHLMEFFERKDTPNKEEKVKLAREATDIRLRELGIELDDEGARLEKGMTLEHIRIFFNNARQKQKPDAKKQTRGKSSVLARPSTPPASVKTRMETMSMSNASPGPSGSSASAAHSVNVLQSIGPIFHAPLPPELDPKRFSASLPRDSALPTDQKYSPYFSGYPSPHQSIHETIHQNPFVSPALDPYAGLDDLMSQHYPSPISPDFPIHTNYNPSISSPNWALARFQLHDLWEVTTVELVPCSAARVGSFSVVSNAFFADPFVPNPFDLSPPTPNLVVVASHQHNAFTIWQRVDGQRLKILLPFASVIGVEATPEAKGRCTLELRMEVEETGGNGAKFFALETTNGRMTRWEEKEDFTGGGVRGSLEIRLKGDQSTIDALHNLVNSWPQLAHLRAPPSFFPSSPSAHATLFSESHPHSSTPHVSFDHPSTHPAATLATDVLSPLPSSSTNPFDASLSFHEHPYLFQPTQIDIFGSLVDQVDQVDPLGFGLPWEPMSEQLFGEQAFFELEQGTSLTRAGPPTLGAIWRQQ